MIRENYSAPQTAIIEVCANHSILYDSYNGDNNQKPNDSGYEDF